MPISDNIPGIFAFMGTLHLLYLTYQDYRRMRVDDRFNWFMIGYSACLIPVYDRGLLYLLATIASVLIIQYFLRMTEFGKGDIYCIGWIQLGCLMINPYSFILFAAILIGLGGLFYGTKPLIRRLLNTIDKNRMYDDVPLPFFGVILISWVLMVISMGWLF